MGDLRFEWDESQARSNQAKHGVSFDEASTVFGDPHALVIVDPDHSIAEERFIILGLSEKLRILVAVHCFREKETVVRLISARKATRNETRNYGIGGRADG